MRIYQLTENYPIDNVRGIGSVPYNQEADYRGLRVQMRPSVFLQLAAPLGRDVSDGMRELIAKKTPIGAPFLMIEIPETWQDGNMAHNARVIGHEGRNRMSAILNIHGDEPIETHLFLSQGWRARDLTTDMKISLRRGLTAEDSVRTISGPLFSI